MTDKAIIIVDDEVIILMTLKHVIQKKFGARFLYDTALNAEAALKSMEELINEGIKIVLILSDWQMPGMNGDEFLIHAKKRYPEIASIMITGRADEDAKKRVMEQAGTIRILDKPWNDRELIEIIESVIDKEK